MERKSDQEIVEQVRKGDIIFARVSPEQKLRIVTVLKEHGEVVAVTGDGANDAPPLREADIGVAMGASGTDVAREAANMILLDDSFASIVKAVESGRAIYENLRKFVVYVFSHNWAELVPYVLYARARAHLRPSFATLIRHDRNRTSGMGFSGTPCLHCDCRRRNQKMVLSKTQQVTL